MSWDENQAQLRKVVAKFLPCLQSDVFFGILGASSDKDEIVRLQSKKLSQPCCGFVVAIRQYAVELDAAGDDDIIRRMRAQANFVESAPFVFALIAAIELSGKGGVWLPYVAGIYVLGRIAHAFGMEASSSGKPRFVGTIITLLTLLGLAIVAALIAAGVM